ncbi:nuclear-pore anchor-like [Ricinus communis]|uniref:nuclear-pore anchor-like n=1 Tax=Ricinus communis TaxID=3988 RepID=UPI00201ADBD4|nr:nuclear-pore anchor-like [Ricinus communis]
MAQKEIVDLQKQVTVLLKECRDIQLRCGSTGHDDADDCTAIIAVEMDVLSDAEKVISGRLVSSCSQILSLDIEILPICLFSVLSFLSFPFLSGEDWLCT